MKDEVFIRGAVPMTKSEVRAVSLAKLELKPSSVVYDIGAGTGSVAVEAALGVSRVYAIEQKAEALELIYQNKEKFGIDNMTVIQGKAPKALENLEPPTHAFIGGSSGGLVEILTCLRKKNPQMRIVINAIALETLALLTQWINREGEEAEVISLQVSKAKTVGAYHLMEGQNPIYIITLEGRKPI